MEVQVLRIALANFFGISLVMLLDNYAENVPGLRRLPKWALIWLDTLIYLILDLLLLRIIL